MLSREFSKQVKNYIKELPTMKELNELREPEDLSRISYLGALQRYQIKAFDDTILHASNSVEIALLFKLDPLLEEIEKTNPARLYGIFGDVLWINKDRLSDELLINLIEHFSTRNLSNSNVSPDMLGQAYEFLIKKFADISNRKAGEFYTPRAIVHLMGNILKPQEGESVYDPACGSGGMLLEAVNYVKENKGTIRKMILDVIG